MRSYLQVIDTHFIFRSLVLGSFPAPFSQVVNKSNPFHQFAGYILADAAKTLAFSITRAQS